MRADQPLRLAAAPTVSSAITSNLIISMLRLLGTSNDGTPRRVRPLGGFAGPSRNVTRQAVTCLCRLRADSVPFPPCDRRPALRPAVGVFEPHDVVELRRRGLEDRRVLERGHTVDRA